MAVSTTASSPRQELRDLSQRTAAPSVPHRRSRVCDSSICRPELLADQCERVAVKDELHVPDVAEPQPALSCRPRDAGGELRDQDVGIARDGYEF